MLKNSFLIVLGILSLLLVAMAISSPLSNTPTSAERGRAADAARWTAMAERYQSVKEAQNLSRGQAADAVRWTTMSNYYLQVFGK